MWHGHAVFRPLSLTRLCWRRPVGPAAHGELLNAMDGGPPALGDFEAVMPRSGGADKGKEEATGPVGEAMGAAPGSGEIAALLQRTSLASMGIARSSPPGARAKARNAASAAAPGCVTHVMSRTDTLEGLAMRYHCTVAELKKLNTLWSERDIHSRATLIVPLYDERLNEQREERSAKVELYCQTTGCVDRATATAALSKVCAPIFFFPAMLCFLLTSALSAFLCRPTG